MYINLEKSKKQLAFSLIEMLITLFILTFGLLGIAGIMLLSFGNNQDTITRSQASILMHDMTERMRVNMIGVKNNAYINIDTRNIIADQNCESATCDNLQMATYDIKNWKDNIENLISGYATIACIDNDNSDTDVCSDSGMRTSPHRITLFWSQNNTPQQIIKEFIR
ncbi:MAG: type IV pilus modification protein PilV [Methylococcales bacterium]|jgi:type IV pilus assembly protein PilV|nr:type IV pilus modification protein PilV [Methylococcales bacterium]MBT7411247.1 type IV pilus modification protein PilV [Methylococcales bacterium]